MPSATAAGEPINLADDFDVPVFVRHSFASMEPDRRPSRKQIDTASAPWPGGHIPQPGAYRVHTTWRDVLDAAMTVGRDPVPWLSKMPGLASSEIIARRAPLAAYLHRTDFQPKDGEEVVYQLEPNDVYREGTEKTARALFGYRIGMTMAEWACRGLMSLGPTIHAEITTPPGHGPLWSPKNSQPDLVGYHWRFPQTWLVEAKGHRKLGQTRLRDGARQLSTPGLMNGPHIRVLCGTSIEHRVFMTIDLEAVLPDWPERVGSHEPRRPGPDDNDEELFTLARSRMLTYYALQGLPRSALTVRPVGPAPDERQSAARLTRPLEDDPLTDEERRYAQENPEAYARRPASSRADMLTGRVPGTNLLLGMSRRLFAACHSLAYEHAAILEVLDRYGVDVGPPPAPPALNQPGTGLARLDDLDDEEYEKQVSKRRVWFAEIEDGERARISDNVRQAYDAGREREWQQLIDLQPPVQLDSSPALLEGATADTYIAIDNRIPPAGA